MTSSTLLSIVTFIYGFAAVLYVANWIFRASLLGETAFWLWIAGILGNTTGFFLRWVESYRIGYGHAPLSNLYESLVFFALTAAVLYFYVERRTGKREVGAFVGPVVFLAMAYASLSPKISDKINPLIPALKSNWLISHVFTCFLGYAGFAVAFCTSIMYLLKPAAEGGTGIFSRLPERDVLDDLGYRMIIFGFLFLSLGIITGSVWANSAWGTYWSWDPKETWSLITWIVYAILLHARMMRDWNGTRIAWVSIVGFVAVLITYFGVNYLPGLHSYGSM